MDRGNLNTQQQRRAEARGAEVKRLLRGVRRVLGDRGSRLVWQSLVAFGAFHVGPLVLQHVPHSPPHPHDPFARSTPAGVQSPEAAGPVAAHPERLCENLPLSPQELLLARELWPAHYSEGHSDDS